MVNECLSLEICQDCSQHPSCKGCKMGKRWTRMTNFPSLVDIIHLEHCICLAGFDPFPIIPTYGNGIIDFHQFDAELGPHQWHLLPTLKLNRWGVLAHEHQLMTRKQLPERHLRTRKRTEAPHAMVYAEDRSVVTVLQCFTHLKINICLGHPWNSTWAAA